MAVALELTVLISRARARMHDQSAFIIRMGELATLHTWLSKCNKVGLLFGGDGRGRRNLLIVARIPIPTWTN